jgi:hypothetical protein
MGAWGEGMQANDTAWDAIGDAGFKVHGAPPKKVLAELAKKPATVKKYFRSILLDAHAVLGLAEYLLDAGVNLASIRKTLDVTLKKALSASELSTWGDPENRKAALLRFRDRLDGKKIDEKKLAEDNEGLFSKMSKGLG